MTTIAIAIAVALACMGLFAVSPPILGFHGRKPKIPEEWRDYELNQEIHDRQRWFDEGGATDLEEMTDSAFEEMGGGWDDPDGVRDDRQRRREWDDLLREPPGR